MGRGIGPFAGNQISSNRVRLANFLASTNTVASDTYFETSWSWKSTRGTTSKIDYVISGGFVHLYATAAYIMDGVPLQIGPSEDHRPVCVVHDMPVGNAVVQKKTWRPYLQQVQHEQIRVPGDLQSRSGEVQGYSMEVLVDR